MRITVVIGFCIAFFITLTECKTIDEGNFIPFNDDPDASAAMETLYEEMKPNVEFGAIESAENGEEYESNENEDADVPRVFDKTIQKDKKNNPVPLPPEVSVTFASNNKAEFLKDSEDVKSIAIKSDFIMWLLVSAAGVVMVMVIGLAVWVRIMDESSSGRIQKFKEYVGKIGEWKKSKPTPNNPLANAHPYTDEKIDIMDIDRAGRNRAEDDTDEENEDDADFTVYECQGPASASDEMEIRNPLFHSKMGGGNEIGNN